MSFKHTLSSVLLLGSMVASGCVSTVAIRSTEPGLVPVGATQHLAVLDGNGRRTAREFLHIELSNMCRARGYFSVTDRSEDGFEVRVAGRRVIVDGVCAAGCWDPH